MSNRGNVRSGNCLVAEFLYRGCRGNVRSGKCLVGELSIRRGTVYGGSVLGEVSVGEMSGYHVALRAECVIINNTN